MKMFGLSIMFVAIVGLVGCGKTMTELRTDGDAIIDNGVSFTSQTLGTIGTLVKKVLGAGFAIYDLGKKIVDDTQDNVGTVVNTVTGASETPAAPAP